MAQYTITEEGTPIIPYALTVQISVNHTASENTTWVTATPYPSQAFSDAVDAHTSTWENVIKTASEFTTQDTNRNGSWSVTAIGPNYEDPAKTDYALTTADTKENEFFTNRPLWVPL